MVLAPSPNIGFNLVGNVEGLALPTKCSPDIVHISKKQEQYCHQIYSLQVRLLVLPELLNKCEAPGWCESLPVREAVGTRRHFPDTDPSNPKRRRRPSTACILTNPSHHKGTVRAEQRKLGLEVGQRHMRVEQTLKLCLEPSMIKGSRTSC